MVMVEKTISKKQFKKMILSKQKERKKEYKENLKEFPEEKAKLFKKYKLSIEEENESFIELRNVNKYFLVDKEYQLILKNINLKIPEHKIVVLLGPSGSGKTTIFNLVSGLIENEIGDVVINGTNLSFLNDEERTIFRKKNVSFVFQEYNLLKTLNNKDNILLGKDLLGTENKNIFSIEELIKLLGIEKEIKKNPNNISGGQQQRVSIARALIKNPKLLLADEPTGALDSENAKETLKLFKEINEKFGTTIFLITHNSAIAKMADFVLTLKNGEIFSFIENKEKLNINELDF